MFSFEIGGILTFLMKFVADKTARVKTKKIILELIEIL